MTLRNKLMLLLASSATMFCFSVNLDHQASLLYLDLIKKCLINTIYEDPGIYNPFDLQKREAGKDFPQNAHTMIGLEGLNNIQECLEDIITNNVPGDFIETGVWRGGATIFMRAFLKAYNIADRQVWVADSFEGLPKPNISIYPEDTNFDLSNVQFLSISLEQVKKNFLKYNLLDNQVKFLKGWFKDTLPNAPIGQIALLRLDGDLYESTMDSLINLYPKVSLGGYIIIDDYGAVPPSATAVHTFRKSNHITDEIKHAGWSIIYWKKTH